MISRRQLEAIAALTSDDGILSAYIKIEPRLGYDRNQAVAKFKGASRRFERSLTDERWRKALARERKKVEAQLEELSPQGQSIAIFSCTPAGIWELFVLDFMLPTLVSVDRSTHTSLLSVALDEYPRMAVAILEGENARIYFIEQARAELATRIKSDIPGRHDQGGWAQARFQRHIEFHGKLHLKKIVDSLSKLYYEEPFDRLAVVGVHDATNEFTKMLPEPLSGLVLGTLTADFKQENDDAILERVRALRAEAERRREEGAVTAAIEAADAGERAAVGTANTIRAIVEKRVQTLLVAGGVTAFGAVCLDCGFLTSERPGPCPVCSAAMEATVDLIELTVDEALLQGAGVDTVFGPARESLLAHGGLAALLRF